MIACADDEEVRLAQHWGEPDVAKWNVFFDVLIAKRGLMCPPYLAIAELESDQLLGSFSIQGVLPGVHAELGWSLGPDGRGRGLSEEALQLALAHLHEHVGVRTVVMGTAVDNVRALRQIAAVGGVVVVEHRDYQAPNGDIVPSIWFAHTV